MSTRMEMLRRLSLCVLMQGLALLLTGPACEATSLGMSVHVVPLDSDGGKMVRAHFIVIAQAPCPGLTGLCAEGEDCLVHKTSLPFSGSKPTPGWCARQWQKTVPSNYTGHISLGSSTESYVSLKANPLVRWNSGRLNHPAFVALPPPLRARVNCPHHFSLPVKDLDGDRVRCRFAQADQAECVSCPRHSFIELDEEKCMLTFTGNAAAGTYFIYLMAEDLIPVPKYLYNKYNTPLSSVPVHVSLTVEESVTRCSDEPVASSDTPKSNSVMFVLPYEEVKFNINFMSELESVSEMAVVGPPALFRVGFKSIGPLAMMGIAWVRAENKLPPLLPVCFAANTNSLQSEPRCVWLYQRKMRTLPAGTELKCEKTEMTLVLPIASLTNIDIAELQFNSPTCPVSYNNTHLTARISLNGCGTKTVHSGSELIYTNTLRSVRPYTMVSRKAILMLPLACRIPGSQVKGPHYNILMPTEKGVFGDYSFELQIFLPGEGPKSNLTRSPKFRSMVRSSPRIVRSLPESNPSFSDNSHRAIGSKIDQIDLHVFSNCSIDRAELIVSECSESETEDFEVSRPFLNQGCSTSNTLEIVTSDSNLRIYRLDLKQLEVKGSLMYIKCTVNLCITTLPSQKCPELCSRSFQTRNLVNSVFTRSYVVRSDPVSVVYTTPAPTTPTAPSVSTSTAATTTTSTSTSTSAQPTTSHAPRQSSFVVAGVFITTLRIILQNIVLY